MLSFIYSFFSSGDPASTEPRPTKRQCIGSSPSRPSATGGMQMPPSESSSPIEPTLFLASTSAKKRARLPRLCSTQQMCNRLSEETPSLTTNTASSRDTGLLTPDEIAEARTESWKDLPMPDGLPLGTGWTYRAHPNMGQGAGFFLDQTRQVIGKHGEGKSTAACGSSVW
jgi:hypothetical protein